MDLQENPPLMYHNFEKLIARGGLDGGEATESDTDTDTDDE